MYGVTPLGVYAYGYAPSYVSPVLTSENVLFVSPYALELAVLTASSSVSAALAVSNLQDQDPTRVWRSVSNSNQYLDITTASLIAANSIAMAGFKNSSQGKWRWKAYPSASSRIGDYAEIFDSGLQSVWPGGFKHDDPDFGPETALLRVNNDVPFKYSRLFFFDPDVSFFEVGRLAIDRASQFSINCDFGNGIGFQFNDVQEPNGFGGIATDPRPPNRTFDMTWSALAQIEANSVAMSLSRIRRMSGDIFCFLDPSQVELFHLWSMQALFTGRHDYKSVPMMVQDVDGIFRMAWGFTFSLIQKL